MRKRRPAKRRRGKVRPTTPVVGGNGAALPPPRARRRERLIVRRVDIGSVFKLSLLFYLTLSCVALVAALLLWLVATGTGLRENVEKFIGDLVVAEDFRLVGSKMLRLGAVLSGVVIVLGTAANLVMATLYNLISDMIGGMRLVVERSEPSVVGADALEVGDDGLGNSRPRPRVAPTETGPKPTAR